MLCLPGSPALSDFRLDKLHQQLKARGIKVDAISSHYLHLVDAPEGALDETGLLILKNLLSYGPAMTSVAVSGQAFFVVPRPGTISPWASKATDIAHNCGLEALHRIERGIVYRLDSDLRLSFFSARAKMRST